MTAEQLIGPGRDDPGDDSPLHARIGRARIGTYARRDWPAKSPCGSPRGTRETSPCRRPISKTFLGAERFFLENARKTLPPGVATGLAWTESGGDVLYIEAVLLPESDRSDRLTLTGQLGSVMQESAKAARSYVVSHFSSLGIEPNAGGVHIHVPAGAIPKDGPSAGVTMATALASLYSGYPVRNDTAMTGEITLTGMVLPVGGIKEKVLAARRAGLKRVILPKENEKDVAELPEDVRNSMEFEFAERIEDVLGVAIPQLGDPLASVAVK